MIDMKQSGRHPTTQTTTTLYHSAGHETAAASSRTDEGKRREEKKKITGTASITPPTQAGCTHLLGPQSVEN